MKPLPDEIACRLPHPSLVPLVRRLDDVGLVEHSYEAWPTADFGHCTDDAGRALGLAVQHDADPAATLLASTCLEQLDRSLRDDGHFLVRLDERGEPTGDPPSDDATARALWGLAVAASDRRHPGRALAAFELLERVAPFESEHPRAAAHAVLAGTTLLDADRSSELGRRLVSANLVHIPAAATSVRWPWPETRLSYANALLPEATISAGRFVVDDAAVVDAVELLRWLVELQWTADDHFSFVPTSGRGVDDAAGFDQQPIEPWTLATACLQALIITGDAFWLDAIGWAAAWFIGENDRRVVMWDPATGAAYDGLTPLGVNLNQGTESTLAFIATLHAYRCALATTVAQQPRSSSR